MIEFIDVTKKYTDLTAVDRLNMVVESGEFFGLLGPNGAGKSTIIKMLTTLAIPSSGIILIDGMQVDRNNISIKSKLGIVPQSMNLDIELSVQENLALHGRLFRMQKKMIHNQIDYLLDFTGLEEKRNVAVRHLSGGMQRKLMIARALIHKPDILLLDEPTIGLDAAVRRKMWDLMRGLNRNGLTVILTTHYIEEAQMLCNRIGLIEKGRLIKLDTPQNLILENGSYILEEYDQNETKIHFFRDQKQAMEFALTLHGEVNIREANLEDTFIQLTNRGGEG